MRRRALTLGAALLPSLALAQPRRPRIGFLHPVTLNPALGAYSILRPLWRRLGYVEGDTVLLRTAGGDPTRLPGLVEGLLAEGVRVIIANGAEAVRAAALHGRGVPVVALDLETNPVGTGLARSLSRPGGSVTGFFLDQPSLAAKWLDLLLAVRPRLRLVGLIWDPSTGTEQMEIARAATAARGLEPVVVDWRRAEGWEAALVRLAGDPSGIMTLTAPGFSVFAPRLGEAARRLGLPAVTFLPVYLGSGLLLSYGPDQPAHFGRAMGYVERILAGTSPGELPIVLPERFRLVLDGRAARAIGVEFPLTLLAQAEEVIE